MEGEDRNHIDTVEIDRGTELLYSLDIDYAVRPIIDRRKYRIYEELFMILQ